MKPFHPIQIHASPFFVYKLSFSMYENEAFFAHTNTGISIFEGGLQALPHHI
jgi:hypothetical protein